MILLSDLYQKKDEINKQLYSEFDPLNNDLLKNKLMNINCQIIKMLVKRGK